MQIVWDAPKSGCDYVKNGVLHMGSTGGGVLIENASQISELPADYKPGTMAHTAGWKAAWEKDAAGTWVNIVGGE